MDDDAVEEFEDHPAFEREGDAHVVRTTAFDAVVGDAPGDPGAIVVRVRVPTIDAAVAGETVAPVVAAGWFETFERRMEDVGGVTRRDVSAPTVTEDASAGEVVVEVRLTSATPGVAADAKAVVDYVEGTFVEGLIPGYTYRGPAAGLIERARSAGER